MSKHQNIASKIKSLPELLQALKIERENDKSIVFTNGCFDILHKGHVDYLAKAADKGDVLIVAVNADESVRRLGKSPSRPIQDQDARAYLIAALESVSYVFLFFEDTPKEVIDQIVPNVLVKGSDYKAEDIVGYDTVIKIGGKV